MGSSITQFHIQSPKNKTTVYIYMYILILNREILLKFIQMNTCHTIE
ncbi:hypothetical protein MADA3029_10025 [Vibrio nigripulchritudo MADA3029]|nr:hypothetical protein VIBNIMADA3020_230006 [Vibrio nigripulchritudo MADA3020]CCN51202.1 hypothetical protein VIBNIMADA3021_1020006 [Vibrio nigripulchritudo MADA3021]CCN56783.1 hypothetical protein MADA3029_10025 [Vibrio nigripulchritudo MADA3029]